MNFKRYGYIETFYVVLLSSALNMVQENGLMLLRVCSKIAVLKDYYSCTDNLFLHETVSWLH